MSMISWHQLLFEVSRLSFSKHKWFIGSSRSKYINFLSSSFNNEFNRFKQDSFWFGHSRFLILFLLLF